MSLNILKWIDILIRRNSTAWGPPDWMHTFSMIFFRPPPGESSLHARRCGIKRGQLREAGAVAKITSYPP